MFDLPRKMYRLYHILVGQADITQCWLELVINGSFIFFSNDSLFSNASFFEKNLYLLLKSLFDFENLKASLNDFICLFEIFICFFQSSFSLLASFFLFSYPHAIERKSKEA